MTESIDDWVDSLRGEHESDKEWTIKKSFLLAHHDKYEKERLVCLSNCFINMEMYGCRYPQEVMHEIQGLSAQLSELVDYRKDKKQREANRVKFVQATSEPTKRKTDEHMSAPKSKFPTFVSAGTMTSSSKTEPNEKVKSDVNLNSGSNNVSDLREKLTSRTDGLQITFNSNTEGSRTVLCSDNVSQKPSLNNRVQTRVRDMNVQVSCPQPQIAPEYRQVYEKVKASLFLDNEAIHRVLILDSMDPVTSFIMVYAASSSSMLSNSLSNAKHCLSSQEMNGCYQLVLDKEIVAKVKVKAILPHMISLSGGNKTRTQKVATLLNHRLLEYLVPRAWLIIRKHLNEASGALTSDGMQSKGTTQTPVSKGLGLLKSLGWVEGTGLGSREQGIKEPVAVETTMNRQGLGFGDGLRSLKKCANDFFSSYVRDARSDLLVFSSEFTSDDRKILHQVAQAHGLKTRSRGKDDKRCLTVTRKGVTLGAQIKELVDSGTYECDWCTIIPPGTEISWAGEDNS